MDNKPNFSSGSVMSRLEIFTDREFVCSVRATETTLDNPDISPRSQQEYIETAIETLNEHFGTEEIRDQVNVAGYAYIADEAGRLLRDETGDVVEGNIECDEVTYSGIDIIDIRNKHNFEEKGKSNYKVVCRFKRTIGSDDGTKFTETYYMPPSNVMAFRPSYETYDENEDLQVVIKDYAEAAEKAIHHYTFTLASGREQYRILWKLADELGDDVVETYGHSTISVNASEFFVITPAEDGESPEIYLINQTTTPPEEWVMPKGEVVGCQFIESILHQGDHTVKIKTLIREYPCLVLKIKNSNSTCLIPIRAINFVEAIDEN